MRRRSMKGRRTCDDGQEQQRVQRTNEMSECGLDTPVPDWVIDHPETLATFRELGMDYCCGGKSLAYACRERGLDAAAVLAKLHCRPAAGHDDNRSAKAKQEP